jgi:mannosyltransferase OCH1-like enzyme
MTQPAAARLKKENKIVHGLWIGDRLSLMEQLSIKSFLANGHEYHLYVYNKVKNIPEKAIIEDANKILPKSRIFKYKQGLAKGSYSGFADLFRLKLLLDKGGIWADLDVICLRPFNFKSKYVFSSEKSREGRIKVHNGIIKSPKGSKCMKFCFKEAEKISPESLKHCQTGGDLLGSAINRFNLRSFVVPTYFFCPIAPRDFKKLIKPNFDFRVQEETYAIHLWNEFWVIGDKTGFINRAVKPILYKVSAKLRSNSRSYSNLIDVIKRKSFKDEKRDRKPKYNKDKVYNAETLYGKLQRKYL